VYARAVATRATEPAARARVTVRRRVAAATGARSTAAFLGTGRVRGRAEWAAGGFGTLGRAYETALLVTGLGLGIQIVFGAFFLALLTMPLRGTPRTTTT